MKTIDLTEAQFLDQIIDLARLYGWRIAHFRAARTKYGWATPVAGDGKGFPDTVLVKKGFPTIFAEIKREKGKLSPEQEEWLEALRGNPGVMACVWRPSDFEAIQDILSAVNLKKGGKYGTVNLSQQH